jgi:hypothetical protein
MKDLQSEESIQKKEKKVEDNFKKVREDLGTQKKSLQRLNDRVISLERSTLHNQSYLEQIKNLLSHKASNVGFSGKKKSIHILSRESPYINTSISRFFVYEKLVHWENIYELYDPPFIVLALKDIDPIFIDQDINQKLTEIPIVGTASQTHIAGTSSPPPMPPQMPAPHYHTVSDMLLKTPVSSPPTSPRRLNDVERSQSRLNRAPSITSRQLGPPKTGQSTMHIQAKFLWNSICTIDNPYQHGKKITIDRTSWISKSENEKMEKVPFIYPLDPIGYPRNPMGRTGARGRGALPRYGPNHEIMAIVTRWKKHKNKHVFVERRKLLEFIAVKDPTTGLINIPGEKILGDESKFSVVCRSFVELVFDDPDVERGTNFALEDMISFFATFASNDPISSLHQDKNASSELNSTFYTDLGFLATNIYSGYIDDTRNTDNAWVEAEIWNFHYDKDNIFDKKIKNVTGKWREVSSNVRVDYIVADVLKEISEVHNAFYN